MVTTRRNPTKQYHAFCGTCASTPGLTGGMTAVSRWMGSHHSMYPWHDVGMYPVQKNPGKMRRARRAGMARQQSRMHRWGIGQPRPEQAEEARRRRQRHSERGVEARAYRADRDEGMVPLGREPERPSPYYSYNRNPRQRRRRRNPGHGEWIDLLIPVAALFFLLRSGRIQLGA